MKKLKIAALTMCMLLSLTAGAITVSSTAGALSSQVTDGSSVTELTVTGTMDARDFLFIAENMPNLETLNLSGVEIEAYSSSTPVFTTIIDYAADEIPPTSFHGMKKLSSVTLPSSLQSIGMSAFGGCTELISITWPDALTTIGAYAFNGTGLTSVDIPASVTRMDEGAFARCTSLMNVIVNGDVVGEFAFLGDTELSDVQLYGATKIGKGAFNGCTSLTELTIDDPSLLTKIDDEAFINSGLTTLQLSDMESLDSMGNWAFAGSQLDNVEFPSSLTHMGEGAFFYDTMLTTIDAPDLTRIADFQYAGALAMSNSDIVPDGTDTIGAFAFYNNSYGHANFMIPASVVYIGTKAMAGMTGTKTYVSESSTVPALGDSVWAGVDQPNVNLDTKPNSVTDLYAEAEQWKEFHLLRDYLRGDANGDGRVNVADITITANYIMGNKSSEFIFYAADLDSNNRINVADITSIASIIMDQSLAWIRRAPALSSYETNGDALVLSDVVINAGETRTIGIALDNSRAYTSLQFDLTLPEGLSVVSGSAAAAKRLGDHVVTMGDMGDNRVRLMAYSGNSTEIKDSEGDIITLTVQADENLLGGSMISIDNVILVDKQAKPYVGNGCMAMINTATGVEEMNAAVDKVYAYGHTLVIETSEAGEAQLVMTNGIMQPLTVEAGRNTFTLEPGIYIVRLHNKSHKIRVES